MQFVRSMFLLACLLSSAAGFSRADFYYGLQGCLVTAGGLICIKGMVLEQAAPGRAFPGNAEPEAMRDSTNDINGQSPTLSRLNMLPHVYGKLNQLPPPAQSITADSRFMVFPADTRELKTTPILMPNPEYFENNGQPASSLYSQPISLPDDHPSLPSTLPYGSATAAANPAVYGDDFTPSLMPVNERHSLDGTVFLLLFSRQGSTFSLSGTSPEPLFMKAGIASQWQSATTLRQRPGPVSSGGGSESGAKVARTEPGPPNKYRAKFEFRYFMTKKGSLDGDGDGENKKEKCPFCGSATAPVPGNTERLCAYCLARQRFDDNSEKETGEVRMAVYLHSNNPDQLSNPAFIEPYVEWTIHNFFPPEHEAMPAGWSFRMVEDP